MYRKRSHHEATKAHVQVGVHNIEKLKEDWEDILMKAMLMAFAVVESIQ